MRSLRIAIRWLMMVSSLYAQTDRGTITGNVADPAGAVVAAAAIEARNTETGARYQAASTATGNYTLSQVPAGNYEVSVAVPGFKKYIRENVLVQVAQTLRLDITLELGATTESVTVNEAVTLLKTESGELSHNFTSKRLDDLPVLGIGTVAAGSEGLRNYMAAVDLIPGTYSQPNANVRINGSPANSQSTRIEGQDATNAYATYTPAMVQPSVDAVQETSYQTSNYAAEFGQAGGGVVNLTMKSGTNQFHGTAYDYFVNEVFNAGTPFTNDGRGHLIRLRSRRQDWGANLGGPILLPKLYNGHDRSFFFFNIEQFRETAVVNNLPTTVPTLAYRDANFTTALTGRNLGTDPIGRAMPEGTIYDPTSERLAGGVRIRDPYSNNSIPKAALDPVALKVQSLIPLPDGPGLINNITPSFPTGRTTKNRSLKLDHLLSARAKVSFYWGQNITEGQYSTGRAASEGFPDTITQTRGTFIYSHTERLNFDYTLSPTLLLHLGIGFQKLPFSDHSPTLNYDAEKELGLRGGTLKRQFPQFAGMSIAGRGGSANLGPGAQTLTTSEKPTSNASLTWVRNNHTYKIGGEFRTEGITIAGYTNASGSFTFSGDQTTLPSTQGQSLGGGTLGFPYASFLLGAVSSGNIAQVWNTRNGKLLAATFIQDTWKVTRRLTLDYGLRWDYSTYPKEQYGRGANLSPTLPNPTAGGRPGASIYEGYGRDHCNCTFAHNYPYALGPRLGVAYQITPKTVLRAGWGITYFQGSGQEGPTSSSTNPFSSPSFGDPAMLLKDGIPFTPVWPNLTPGQFPLPGTITGAPVVADQNSGRPARQVQWSIGIQREVFRNLVTEASYVGNRGVWWRADSLLNINALTPDRLNSFGLDINNAADRTLLISQVNSAAAAARGFNRLPYAGFPSSLTVAQALRPFPQFGTLNFTNAPLGNTWYDSLQAKVTKRFSYGLDFTYTFTWQKELTIGAESDASGIAASVNDVFNRGQNKYISGYSRPFVSVLAANYTTPKLARNRWLSMLAGNWQFGTVLQYASGLPIKVPASQGNLNSLLFRPTFANRVPGQPLFTQDLNCHCFDPNTTFVLNPKAWLDPSPGQFGTSAAYYSDYRYQRRPQESMSIGRAFRIRERFTAQLRIEFTNIFNRTEMNDPTSTSASATQQRSATGQTTAGFGYISTASTFALPRQGTAVVRFTF